MADGALIAEHFRVCIEHLTDPLPERTTVVSSGQRIRRGGQPRIAQQPIVADGVRRTSRKRSLRSASGIKFLIILLIPIMWAFQPEAKEEIGRQTCGSTSIASSDGAAAELPAALNRAAEDGAAASGPTQLPISSSSASANACQYSSAADSLPEPAIGKMWSEKS